MKRRVSIIVLLIIILSIVSSSPGSTIVYITKTGAKYHRDGCPSLKKSQIAISLSVAIKQGYEPCKICKPPLLTE